MVIISIVHRFIILLFLLFKIKSNLKSNNITDNPNIAVIPFKTFYLPSNQEGSNTFGAKDYYNTIHYSLPYLEIDTGKNINQKLWLFFTSDNYYFNLDDRYFNNEETNNLICHYLRTLSNSYEIDNSKSLYYANNKKYDFAKEYFKIYSDIYLTKYNLYKMNFHHALDKFKNVSYACGEIGLLYASEDLNIISIKILEQ